MALAEVSNQTKTFRVIQQNMCDFYGTSNGLVRWDLYDVNSLSTLKQKIELLLPPEHDIESISADEKLSEKEKSAKKKLHPKIQETHEMLKNVIWSQRKYFGEKVLMSTLYIINTSNQNSIHILFRVRKCLDGDTSNDCCMIFIDECGRVYQNWDDYKKNNFLPEGLLVAPCKGVYQTNTKGEVDLEYFKSPASTAEKKVLVAGDRSAGVAGILCSVAPVATMFTPVGPVLLGASIVGAAAVGAWSIGRSISNLVDRSKHEQTIHVKNREARSAWFGIGAGVVGIAAGGATRALVASTAAGSNVSKVAITAVNTLNVSAVALSGASLANGVVDLILKKKDGDKVSLLDCVQLATSLVLVTHSVYNFQTASNIVKTTQNNTIKGFRDDLSKRQQKIFDKMTRNTISSKGLEGGKIDIIRSLRNIPDKKVFFSDVKRSLKPLTQNNLKPSFSPDGSVLLNNDVSVTASDLRQNIQGTPEVITQKVSAAPVEQTNESVEYVLTLKKSALSATTNSTDQAEQSENKMRTFAPIADYLKDLKNLKDIYIGNESDLKSVLNFLMNKLGDIAMKKFIDTVKYFSRKYGDDIQDQLGRNTPIEEVLYESYHVFRTVCGIYKLISFIRNTSMSDLIDILRRHFNHLCEAMKMTVERFCSEFRISDVDSLRNSLLQLYDNLTEDVVKEVLSIAERIFASDDLDFVKSIKDFVEFDQFLYKIYEIVLKLLGVDSKFIDEHINENTLVLRDLYVVDLQRVRDISEKEIVDEAESFYSSYTKSFGKKIKCKKCRGYYYLNT